MAELFNYLEVNTITKLGIKYRGGLITRRSGSGILDIWEGYDTAAQKKYIIFSKTPINRRVKWYVSSMEIPEDRSEDKIPLEELKKLCEESLTPRSKNSVLAKNLENRLEKLANVSIVNSKNL